MKVNFSCDELLHLYRMASDLRNKAAQAESGPAVSDVTRQQEELAMFTALEQKLSSAWMRA